MTQHTYGERVDAGEPLCEVWVLMMDLHKALKAPPIKARVWTHTWKDADGRTFELKVNGHLKPIDGQPLPPLHLAVDINGWPAVLCDMFGGSGLGGAEAEVCQALLAEVALVRADA